MPTLTVHLAIAAEALARADCELLADHPGDLYLGSTTPDIRSLIGVPRENTHYVGLGERTGQNGVGRFLQSHPAAADFATLSPAGKSFVAGYLSHLVTDETWILEIYRPYFGEASTLAGLPESNLLDRALQFDLEERERQHLVRLEDIGAWVSQAEGFVGLGIADDTAMWEWRERVTRSLEIGDAGRRLRYFASRLAREGQMVPPNRIDGFLAGLPALIARVHQHVPDASIAKFRRLSVETTAEVFKQYLAGDFLGLMRR